LKKARYRAVRVFECAGKAGGFIKVFLVPREHRPRGVDGIRIEMLESGGETVYSHWFKDWEAQAVAAGLNFALLQKKLNKKKGGSRS